MKKIQDKRSWGRKSAFFVFLYTHDGSCSLNSVTVDLLIEVQLKKLNSWNGLSEILIWAIEAPNNKTPFIGAQFKRGGSDFDFFVFCC